MPHKLCLGWRGVGVCLSELRSIHCTQAAEAAAAGTGTGGLADHADETDEVEDGPQVGGC